MHIEQLKAVAQQRKLEQQQLQIQTLREVTMTIMDKINNPIAVILLTPELWRRSKNLQEEFNSRVDSVEAASREISRAPHEILSIREYKTLTMSFGTVLDVYYDK